MLRADFRGYIRPSLSSNDRNAAGTSSTWAKGAPNWLALTHTRRRCRALRWLPSLFWLEIWSPRAAAPPLPAVLPTGSEGHSWRVHSPGLLPGLGPLACHPPGHAQNLSGPQAWQGGRAGPPGWPGVQGGACEVGHSGPRHPGFPRAGPQTLPSPASVHGNGWFPSNSCL